MISLLPRLRKVIGDTVALAPGGSAANTEEEIQQANSETMRALAEILEVADDAQLEGRTSSVNHNAIVEAAGALGGCYLAYDLLGGKRGPLRPIARATGYVALFFIGYVLVLGLRYAIVAASGMGILLGIEFRIAGINPSYGEQRRTVILFGFLRGLVLDLAGITVAGPLFGAVFGFSQPLA